MRGGKSKAGVGGYAKLELSAEEEAIIPLFREEYHAEANTNLKIIKLQIAQPEDHRTRNEIKKSVNATQIQNFPKWSRLIQSADVGQQTHLNHIREGDTDKRVQEDQQEFTGTTQAAQVEVHMIMF